MTWLWVIASAGGLGALGAAFFFGYRYAQAKVEAASGEAFQQAKKEADAHGDEIRKMPDADLDDELSPWMRSSE